jgi:hypothetical protein
VTYVVMLENQISSLTKAMAHFEQHLADQSGESSDESLRQLVSNLRDTRDRLISMRQAYNLSELPVGTKLRFIDANNRVLSITRLDVDAAALNIVPPGTTQTASLQTCKEQMLAGDWHLVA